MSGGYFTTVVYPKLNGEEWEIEVKVSYHAVYLPAKVSGPPESCYPDESELELLGITILDDLPEGMTEEMVLAAAEDQAERLEQEAWEDFLDSRSEREC